MGRGHRWRLLHGLPAPHHGLFILASAPAPTVLNLGKQYFSHAPEPGHLKRFPNLVISPHPEHTAQMRPLHFLKASLSGNFRGKNEEEERFHVVTAKPLFNERKKEKKKKSENGTVNTYKQLQADQLLQIFIVHLNGPAWSDMWGKFKNRKVDLNIQPQSLQCG